MAMTNPPPHLKELIANVVETARLLDIHEGMSGRDPGRRYDVEVLNKSAIVLSVACWEAYVEDLAASALEFMIKNSANHNAFPKSVLERVSSKNSGLSAWNLAGDGWKKALLDNMKEVLAKTAGTLNTPKTAQVDDLFLKTIGLNNLSKTWKWSRRNATQASSALDTLVTLRGGIAHRVKHSRSVRKQDVINALDLIGRLSIRSNNEVRKHVHSCTGKYPWGLATYKRTK